MFYRFSIADYGLTLYSITILRSMLIGLFFRLDAVLYQNKILLH